MIAPRMTLPELILIAHGARRRWTIEMVRMAWSTDPDALTDAILYVGMLAGMVETLEREQRGVAADMAATWKSICVESHKAGCPCRTAAS